MGISTPVETAVEILLVATSKFAVLTVRWHNNTYSCFLKVTGQVQESLKNISANINHSSHQRLST